MPIDASIYQSVKPIPVDLPDPVKTAEAAMTLRQMGMQVQTQNAVRDAYAANTDPQTGQLNQQGFLAHIGKNAPWALPQFQQQYAAINKQQAEAKAAWADAANKALTVTGPKMDYVNSVPEENRPQAYREMLRAVVAQGGDTNGMLPDYDPGFWSQKYQEWQRSEPKLKSLLTQAEIRAKNAEAALVPVKYKNEVFGSRSPTESLAGDYTKDIAPIKSSQIAMRQMFDNFDHPTPQGDASLMLNAFKIKFPNAPDVNSLEELSKSQAIPDQWRKAISQKGKGVFDDETRANLLRDGISTYRANYGTYKDVAEKYRQMAQARDIPLGGMINEPALDRTMAEAEKRQEKLGGYKTPAERGGIGGFISSLTGGKEKEATAAPTEKESGPKKQDTSTKYRPQGASISADELAKYAIKEKTTLQKARAHLEGLGYVIGR